MKLYDQMAENLLSMSKWKTYLKIKCVMWNIICVWYQEHKHLKIPYGFRNV